MKKVIFFILLFFITLNVDASEKVYVNEILIENVYSNKTINGYRSSSRFFQMDYMGKPLYCIGPGYPVSTVGYYPYNINEYFDLTEEQKRNMELVMYYGYMYENHNSIYYYMATQELIWDILGVSTYWTTQSGGAGSIIDITEYKNNILSLSNTYLEQPNFSNIYYYKIGDDITLIDDNNVLKDYSILYSGLNIVSSNNNELNIKFYKMGHDSIVLTRNSGGFDGTTVFKKTGYQTLIQLGNRMNEEYILEFEVYGARLIINRIDSKTGSNISSINGTLEGAIYDIYDIDNNLVSTVTTNNDGIGIVEGLEFGTYYIKEVSPSMGYVHDDKVYTVDLDFGDTPKNIFIDSNVISKNVNILSLYKSPSNTYYEKNIIFEIYKEGILFKTLTSDENGNYNIDLDYGFYIIKQQNNIDGHNKIDDIEIIIDENEKNLNFIFVTELPLENYTEIVEEKAIEKLPQLFEEESQYLNIILIIFIVFICTRKLYCY